MKVSALEGSYISLVPLEKQHIEALYHCSRDPEVWAYLPVKINSLEEMQAFVEEALLFKERGDQFPFVVVSRRNNRVIGMTRFLRIAEQDKTLNIGWTWYAKEVWRTVVNTEAKALLLQYAFEEWKAVRVELITTVEHTESQRAIERLGAKREGVLRKKYRSQDYVCYSIINEEWKEVKGRLERWIKGEGY